jgi:hypothetical protein
MSNSRAQCLRCYNPAHDSDDRDFRTAGTSARRATPRSGRLRQHLRHPSLRLQRPLDSTQRRLRRLAPPRNRRRTGLTQSKNSHSAQTRSSQLATAGAARTTSANRIAAELLHRASHAGREWRKRAPAGANEKQRPNSLWSCLEKIGGKNEEGPRLGSRALKGRVPLIRPRRDRIMGSSILASLSEAGGNDPCHPVSGPLPPQVPNGADRVGTRPTPSLMQLRCPSLSEDGTGALLIFQCLRGVKESQCLAGLETSKPNREPRSRIGSRINLCRFDSRPTLSLALGVSLFVSHNRSELKP